MIDSTEGYKKAIVGDARRMLLSAIVSIIDPDIVYGSAAGSGDAAFSRPEQLHDGEHALLPYATLERRRWLLDGSFRLIPTGGAAGEIGAVGRTLSRDDAVFSPAQYVELRFSNVSVLQACSVWFPDTDYDGFAVDFTVDVKQGGTVYYSQTFTGNQQTHVSLEGFTVNNADAIRVTVTKWSLPGRRMRVAEIVPGLYEEWDQGMLAALSVRHQANFSCLAIPYGTCTLKMDNQNRRFEPRSKDGLFQSIEDRQGIAVRMGVVLESGAAEFKQVGIFYQYSGGWRTGDNDLSMQWTLVDIVGLLVERDFIPPNVLPTTLDGWFAALVAQLGANFASKYHVDPDYASLPVTVSDAAAVTGKKCGEIMRWVCMATGTWPRADAETGDLTAEPLWNEGNKVTLDNLASYPSIKANDDLAAIIFTLADEDNTQYVVSGNSTGSSNTVSVSNPFIRTQAQALAAAKLILSAYGGNQLGLTGRGDPSSEVGDVDTVWLDESSAATARRMTQTLQFQDGVLQGCQSTLLQADGSFLYQERAVITQSGSWTAPAGKKNLRLILVGHGSDGQKGADGTWDEAGEDGADGVGALVWAGTIAINEQQTFAVDISDAGTTFGAYSSADGQRFPYGYTDVASGDSFARTGVKAPLAGSGDGGAGGAGGTQGYRYREKGYDLHGNSVSYWVVLNEPGVGAEGVKGAAGCVVVYWDKEG